MSIFFSSINDISQISYSIKTRIKTKENSLIIVVSSTCQISYSIKTRIKTYLILVVFERSYHVRYHIPLKQGLRLNNSPPKSSVNCVRYHIPLKQGLRPIQEHSLFVLRVVRYHIPLKQGLRLLIVFVYVSHIKTCQISYSIKTRIKTHSIKSLWQILQFVRYHIPLKQGLRRISRKRLYIYM